MVEPVGFGQERSVVVVADEVLAHARAGEPAPQERRQEGAGLDQRLDQVGRAIVDTAVRTRPAQRRQHELLAQRQGVADSAPGFGRQLVDVDVGAGRCLALQRRAAALLLLDVREFMRDQAQPGRIVRPVLSGREGDVAADRISVGAELSAVGVVAVHGDLPRQVAEATGQAFRDPLRQHAAGPLRGQPMRRVQRRAIERGRAAGVGYRRRGTTQRFGGGAVGGLLGATARAPTVQKRPGGRVSESGRTGRVGGRIDCGCNGSAKVRMACSGSGSGNRPVIHPTVRAVESSRTAQPTATGAERSA